MSAIFKHFILSGLAVATLTAEAREVARFTMENDGGKTTEIISGKKFDIKGSRSAEALPGANGDALRFDGFSTYVDATVGDLIPAGSKKFTASVWFAMETYPIVEIDVNTSTMVAIASCLDDTAKSGFGFFVGFDGQYSFKTYVGGWPLEMKVTTPLSRYEWINLTAVVDGEARTATLYNNGMPVATSKANGTLLVSNSAMRIGRSFDERFVGPFCLTSFNGLIDDITVYDEALTEAAVKALTPDNAADLSIPSSRFADDPMRPAFHGMPGANWTNETHGMVYYNNRYHLFFQKNANGPYMARLHWGHLSSENLYDWREEKIAIAPGSYFDIKGCWSGCVFTDPAITGGKPSILYTGVDYVKAVIARANPADDDLIEWNKDSAPIINGRPSGLSDDFRDPYFFRNGDEAYVIVGSSKGNVGTTTLHAYNPTTKTWSNDGRTFFSGTNAASCGTFWEMPNITEIDGKWLFTVTPQNTSKGVASLYWTGSINADGTFNPVKSTPTSIELPGMARDGYGLLSPTVTRNDGKTIAIGIVPDKLPSQSNYSLGYAHTYSLPREWTIDADGNLWQKPFAGLTELRGKNPFGKNDFTLNGSMTLDGVSGRQVELVGEFEVVSGKTGFTILDDGANSVKVFFDGSTNEFVVDARGVERLINDAGVFDGLYRSNLPVQLAKGQTVKIHLFFDHSVLDVFINDRWATSVRIFANARSGEAVTVFADSPANVKSVSAWNLDATGQGAGIDPVFGDNDGFEVFSDGDMLVYDNAQVGAVISVYNVAGMKVAEHHVTSPSGSFSTDAKGLNIVVLQTASTQRVRKVML